MNEVFKVIVREYALYTGADDPATLATGGFFRTFAPQGTATPYVCLTTPGGNISWIFGGGAIERARLQWDVYDKHRPVGSTSKAMKIYEGIVRIFDNVTLPLTENDSIIMRRDGMAQEEADDEYVHVWAQWYFEYQSS